MSDDSTQLSDSTYLNAATQAYTAVMASLDQAGRHPDDGAVTFWQACHAFDTMLDYYDCVGLSSASDAQRVYDVIQALLKPLRGLDGAWFDDLGWACTVSQRAAQSAWVGKDTRDQFQAFGNVCWDRFSGNAPDVWDRRTTTQFDVCEPAVRGGVWNSYWVGTDPTWPGPKGAVPTEGTLAGIQNTVTNTSYLLCAVRRGAVTAVESELAFLAAWLDDGPHSLRWPQGTGRGVLLRERVGRWAHEGAVGYQADWAWVGDQGLMIGALVDGIRANPSWAPTWQSVALDLVRGSLTTLAPQGVLTAYTATGAVPDGDVHDYDTGIGVFWRYLRHAWAVNPAVRNLLGSGQAQHVITTSAAKAQADPAGGGFVTVTNNLATLVAAYRLAASPVAAPVTTSAARR